MLARPDILNPTLYRLLDMFGLNKVYVRGEGNYLYDEQGRKYLDFIAQYGAVPFGYNPTFLWEAIARFHEAGLPSLVQPSVPLKAVELAEKLAEFAPGQLRYATFTQSGAETVEAAIKLVRSATGKFKILSCENSFHGKTLGALSATGREVYQSPFFAPVPGFEKVPFGDLEALEQVLSREAEEIAAFMVEPVQGEGGIIVPPPGYLKAAQELCRRFGVMFVVDEIQTGLGRTGYLLACEKEGVEPDVLLLSKALGGGLVPLGVALSAPWVWNEDYGRLHSSTFANNNFTCHVGLAVLDKLLENEGELLREVREKGKYLLEKTREVQKRWSGVIKEVRGEGLMVGLEFCEFPPEDSFDLIFLSKRGGFCALLSGVLLNVYGIRSAPFLNNPMTVRLEPPLTIEWEEIDRCVAALDQICEIVYKKDYVWLFKYLLGDETRPGQVKDYRWTLREVKSSELNPGEKPSHRFAFLIHYPGHDDLIHATPSLEQLREDQLEKFLDWQAIDPEPEVLCHMPALRCRAGEVIEGWLIGVPFGGKQMMKLPRSVTVPVIQQAVDMARDLGADVVGLGAYTSVVTRGGRDVQGRGVPVTSGNSFTIAVAVEATFLGAEKMGTDLDQAAGAVLGATGSIGRVCAILMGERVTRISLIGNPARKNSSLRRLGIVADEIVEHAMAQRAKGNLRGLAGWLDRALTKLRTGTEEDLQLTAQLENACYLGAPDSPRPFATLEAIAKRLGTVCPITITLEVDKGLRAADVIIAASNSPGYLIGPEHLKPGAVVCDVARPPDVSPAVYRERNDVLVLEGGLVQLPDNIAFGSNLGCREGIALACLSETMLLAFENDGRDYSIGSRIPLETVEHLRGLGAKHGFGLAALHSRGKEITEEEINEIRWRASLRRQQAAWGLNSIPDADSRRM
ncbi:MAG: aminotransferase class III-fold pyridoxal phosphate-dependent enzyme [Syntrophothermus sp.]|uniref:aminotransferase class III-fold pyridoxal phosphate-dependent enzyme n=1 Tax=Syntrophothermus sp. TaxID=2736299 RepID=UPI00257CCE79|nr:aminotransferase class III-fold pyridoxal phosphate-dependent enzyme [Syntrophothermus sp.]NSW82860.1 aminotransferase class III-fold pyridoxal phosphate-dependent enzyme [Syntrophothermus sp.]